MFPQFKDRRIVNRQVKRTILPDIIALGNSIANKAIDKDLDKIFVNREPNTSENQEPVTQSQPNDVQTLLATIT